MKKTTNILFVVLFVFIQISACQSSKELTSSIIQGDTYRKVENISNQQNVYIADNLKKLMLAYPEHIKGIGSNSIIFFDDTVMVFDDGIANKNFDELLNNADLEDQMSIVYPIGADYTVPKKNQDPGRIRYEPFFLKIYGASKEDVKKNLVPIIWLPSSVNKTLMVTKINGVNEKLQKISYELDALKGIEKYINNPAGTFYWRKIAGTNRLSMHSFGIAIDINVSFANYWEWDVQSGKGIIYKNKIPFQIVKVFEKYGFIWGGKWYHYDTMHFEYRPEFFIKDI